MLIFYLAYLAVGCLETRRGQTVHLGVSDTFYIATGQVNSAPWSSYRDPPFPRWTSWGVLRKDKGPRQETVRVRYITHSIGNDEQSCKKIIFQRFLLKSLTNYSMQLSRNFME